METAASTRIGTRYTYTGNGESGHYIDSPINPCREIELQPMVFSLRSTMFDSWSHYDPVQHQKEVKLEALAKKLRFQYKAGAAVPEWEL